MKFTRSREPRNYLLRSSRRLKFSLGKTSKTHQVANVELTWDNFRQRAEKFTVGRETQAEYCELSADRQASLKDVGHFTPAHYADGVRKRQNISARSCLTLDADHSTPDFLERLTDPLLGLGHLEWIVYSTRKHTDEQPRWRLVMPLSRDVDELEHGAISRWLADSIETGDLNSSIDWFDDTTFQFTRLQYWASRSSDAPWVFHHNQGEWLDPDSVLNHYSDWKDISTWPTSSRTTEKLRAPGTKATDPRSKGGVIGAFCRVYDIWRAIEKYLPDAYTEGSGPNRLSFTGGSSSNGAVVYDDGLFLYSNHESDPVSGQNVNAFDLVRLHLFGTADTEAGRNVPVTELPSYASMQKLALEDPDVAADLKNAEGYQADFDDFEEEENGPSDQIAFESETERIALSPRVRAEIQAASHTTMFLPNDYVPAAFAAERIFTLMGANRELFRRGDMVVELIGPSGVKPVTPTALRSRLNHRGRKVRAFKAVHSKGKVSIVSGPKQASDDTANLLLQCRAVKCLPAISLVCRFPALAEADGALLSTETGYNAVGGGILVREALDIPIIEPGEAAELLSELLCDFQFVEEGDRSRALASLIAPALRMSGLIDGNALVACVEADDSQAGKGYLLKTIREIYGEQPFTITKRNGGVGSFDESLASALLSGSPFISIDNVRGKISSEYFESTVTAGNDPVSVRVPHRGEAAIDTNRVTFQLTSNGIEATQDLGNRLLVIRIVKQPAGYSYRQFEPGRNLLQHVAHNRGKLLGAVHSIVRKWHVAGKPVLPTEHSFREWVGSLDWIVQKTWKAVPLLEGHGAAISRVSNPAVSWLRGLALALVKAGVTGVELTASQLWGHCESLDIALPGGRGNLSPELGARAAGTYLARCFSESDELELGGIRVRRLEHERYDPGSRHTRTDKRYVFSTSDGL